MGSGRTGGYPTAEATASFVLTTESLKGFPPGAVGRAMITFRSQWHGELPVSMGVSTAVPDLAAVDLMHVTRDGAKERIRYLVRLTATRPRYGGLRWWFVCPATGRRAAKLYLPYGGRRFLSRAGYRLGYATTREGKLSRRQGRAVRLLARLGQPGADWTAWAPRPKWMRRRTYERLCAELSAVQEGAEAIFAADVWRRFRCVA